MNEVSIAAPHKMTAHEGGVESGIAWATVKAPIWGGINGYVQIPADHPWHGLDDDAIDVGVHGGLTYNSGDWIGFDTMHAGDLWPDGEMPHYCGDRECDCIVWTPEAVADEARALARKVAESA